MILQLSANLRAFFVSGFFFGPVFFADCSALIAKIFKFAKKFHRL
jgi:hypothetical protein